MIRFCGILFSLSLLTLACHSVATATTDPQLREILNKHWEAMGGMSNWSKVESIRLNGTIERDGQIVDICIIKKRPNQIRATVTLPLPGSEDKELQVIRAHDGKTAWTATRIAGAPEMKKVELPPDAARELLVDAGVLPPLIKFWREGAEIELAESQVINGENAYSLKATVDDSGHYVFYLSTESFQLLAYDSIKQDATTTRTSITEYITEAEVMIPRGSIIESPATGASKMTTTSVEVGVGIFEEYFVADQSPNTAQLD